jgi:hypothetical protein
MALRPYLMTGVALASAGAIVAAMPAADFGRDVEVRAAAPAPIIDKITAEQIQLLAVTLQGLFDSIFNGYGGIVTAVDPDGTGGDPANPGDGLCTEEDEVCAYGPVGLAYYLLDQTIFAGTLLDNQIFETGLGFILPDAPLIPFLPDAPLIPFLPDAPLIPFLPDAPLLPVPDVGAEVINLIVQASGVFGPVAQDAVEAFFNEDFVDSRGVPSQGWIASLNSIVESFGGIPFAAAAAEGNVELLSQTPGEEVEKKTEESNPGFAKLGTGRLVGLTTNTLDQPFAGSAADPVGTAPQATVTKTDPKPEVVEPETEDETEGEETGGNRRGVVRNGLSFGPGGSNGRGGFVPFEDRGADAGGWNPLGAIADALGGGGGGWGNDDRGGDDDGDDGGDDSGDA